jgi:hypothetical protein
VPAKHEHIQFWGAACLALAFLLLSCNPLAAFEANGNVSLEGFIFLDDPAWPQQKDQSASLAASIELYQSITDSFQFTLEAMYRLDSMDPERTHGDVRLAEFLYFTDLWEISVGVGRVFWGATEFVHLVDIINQTDQVEDLYGEEKLGQPMVHLTVPRDWGVVEAFALPLFRERTFPGSHGRFRSPLAVDSSLAVYESDSEQYHTDFALRYATTVADADLGLYYFNGTARNPVLLFADVPGTGPSLYPYYEQIGQSGLDLQLNAGEWLLKAEALYRIGQSRSYGAGSWGFEYTLVGLGDSLMNLGLIGEYVYDDRDDGWLPTLYENDLMAGLRLSVNDMDDTTLLLGVIRDIPYGSTIIALEASRRMGESMLINLNSSFFINMDIRDPAYALSRDNFIQLELIWYW